MMKVGGSGGNLYFMRQPISSKHRKDMDFQIDQAC